MGNTENKRPSKRYQHKPDSLDAEFKNAYQHLAKCYMGPFRFYYDPDITVDILGSSTTYGGLCLQVFVPTTKRYKTVMVFAEHDLYDISMVGSLGENDTDLGSPGND